MKRLLCIIFLFTLFSNSDTHAEINSVDNNSVDKSIDVDDVGDEDLDDEGDFDNEDAIVDDPYEKINRKIFELNKSMDNIINKFSDPSSKPGIVRQGLSNFAQNFFEIPRFINYTLQGNGNDAIKTIGRYLINTCLGFFGFIDVAEKIGLEKKRTTFNDTLKKWGVPSGPFVVLPFLGPTCMRGTVSQAVHISLDTTALIPIKDMNTTAKSSIYCISWFFDALNTRSAYSDFLGNITAMSKDEYKTVRNLIMAVENQ